MTEYLNVTHKVLCKAGDYIEDPESWGRSWDHDKLTLSSAITKASRECGLSSDHATCIIDYFRHMVPVVCQCDTDDDLDDADFFECCCVQYSLGNETIDDYNDNDLVTHDDIKSFIFDICWNIPEADYVIYDEIEF